MSLTGRIGVLGICLLWFHAAPSVAQMPSTNDANRGMGWAHVNVLDSGIGTIELELVSARGFASCFEYRTDGDASQATAPVNFNPAITDGLYPFVCRNNDTSTLSLSAIRFVEVRMVFGAEADERFDWTRFDVLVDPAPAPVAGAGGVAVTVAALLGFAAWRLRRRPGAA